jgi:hypothetical protein
MEDLTLTGEERLVLERLRLLEQNDDHHVGPLGHAVQPQEIHLPGIPAGHTLNKLRKKQLVARTRNSGSHRVYYWKTTKTGRRTLA